MKCILLIENDREVVESVRPQFNKSEFELSNIADGTSGLAWLRANPPDLLVLNATLPGLSGLEVLQHIRQDDLLHRLPVVMLSDPCKEAERVSRLDMGADDLVTKPFSPRELLARVKALLWRADVRPRRKLLKFDKLVIDCDFGQVTRAGRTVSMSVLEFRLLSHLATSAGQVFSREQLLELVWGPAESISVRSVDVSIRRLREKVERNPKDPQLLRSVYGSGYVFQP